jgi:hypothetical protein
MRNLQAILREVEQYVQVVEDSELRKIAFQELLLRSLRDGDIASDEEPRNKPAILHQAKKRTPATTRAVASVTVRPEVESLELSPDEPLAAWDGLSADWKKFCWVLEAARLKDVDGLTNSEISYLIEKIFRENYPITVVNNLKVQLKKGMVKSVVVNVGGRDYRVWKILRGGTNEVASKTATAVTK